MVSYQEPEGKFSNQGQPISGNVTNTSGFRLPNFGSQALASGLASAGQSIQSSIEAGRERESREEEGEKNRAHDFALKEQQDADLKAKEKLKDVRITNSNMYRELYSEYSQNPTDDNFDRLMAFQKSKAYNQMGIDYARVGENEGTNKQRDSVLMTRAMFQAQKIRNGEQVVIKPGTEDLMDSANKELDKREAKAKNQKLTNQNLEQNVNQNKELHGLNVQGKRLANDYQRLANEKLENDNNRERLESITNVPGMPKWDGLTVSQQNDVIENYKPMKLKDREWVNNTIDRAIGRKGISTSAGAMQIFNNGRPTSEDTGNSTLLNGILEHAPNSVENASTVFNRNILKFGYNEPIKFVEELESEFLNQSKIKELNKDDTKSLKAVRDLVSALVSGDKSADDPTIQQDIVDKLKSYGDSPNVKEFLLSAVSYDKYKSSSQSKLQKASNMFNDPKMIANAYIADRQGIIKNSAEIRAELEQLIYDSVANGTLTEEQANIEILKLNPPTTSSLQEVGNNETKTIGKWLASTDASGNKVSAQIREKDMKYIGTAYNIAKQAGLPPELFVKQIYWESHYNPNKPRYEKHLGESSWGLGQVLESTGKSLGYSKEELKDPVKNLQAAATYLKQGLKESNGNIKDALIYYNAGPGGLKEYKRRGNKFPPGNKYTQDYLDRILGKGWENKDWVLKKPTLREATSEKFPNQKISPLTKNKNDSNTSLIFRR